MKELFYKHASTILLSVITFFSPTYQMMLAVGFFVAADLVTGLVAAYKKQEPIVSKKLRTTISKGLGYMIAILVAHVFQVKFMPSFQVMSLVSAALAAIELKSIDENMQVITGKSLFKQFIKK